MGGPRQLTRIRLGLPLVESQAAPFSRASRSGVRIVTAVAVVIVVAMLVLGGS